MVIYGHIGSCWVLLCLVGSHMVLYGIVKSFIVVVCDWMIVYGLVRYFMVLHLFLLPWKLLYGFGVFDHTHLCTNFLLFIFWFLK